MAKQRGDRTEQETAASMEELPSTVRQNAERVTDIMSEISAASQEQSAGTEQVNQTVTQMDEDIQQNAALVEEATAAARSMEDQVNQLSDFTSADGAWGSSGGAL